MSNFLCIFFLICNDLWWTDEVKIVSNIFTYFLQKTAFHEWKIAESCLSSNASFSLYSEYCYSTCQTLLKCGNLQISFFCQIEDPLKGKCNTCYTLWMTVPTHPPPHLHVPVPINFDKTIFHVSNSNKQGINKGQYQNWWLMFEKHVKKCHLGRSYLAFSPDSVVDCLLLLYSWFGSWIWQ